MNTNDRCVMVGQASELAPALERLGVRPGHPVLVLIGGADGMGVEHVELVRGLLRDAVLPVLIGEGAAVVDGGTDSGAMRIIGQLHDNGFPLVGVVAEGTVGDTELEPNHLHVLVPGDSWGDESPWLAEVASVLAGDHPSVTLLVNGGEIAYTDAAHSIERGRPLVVLAGTGRTADVIAAAAEGTATDHRAVAIAASPLTRVVTAADLAAVIQAQLDTSG